MRIKSIIKALDECEEMFDELKKNRGNLDYGSLKAQKQGEKTIKEVIHHLHRAYVLSGKL